MTLEAPVTPEEFDSAMKKLGLGAACPKIAVAVSGGGDSLALALLLKDWAGARGGALLALTVDHGLRSGSAAEAASAGEVLRRFDIAHDILTWRGEKPSSRVQERAREARYDLLLEACRRRGFPVLALAHNEEDQAETFWMRLAHGSGLDGLAAMAARQERAGVTLIRPLLGFSRARLRATCNRFGAPWIEDPSNTDQKYLRVKLRAFESLLAEEDLTPARLARTMQKLEDARTALESFSAEAFAACATCHEEGYVTLKRDVWAAAPVDIQRRVLTRALRLAAPSHAYPTGFEALEALRLDMQAPSFAGRTLAGCEIFPGGGSAFLFVREAAAVEPRCAAAEGRLWDGRFALSGAPCGPLEIGALGEENVSVLRKNEVVQQKLEGIPFKVRRVLPALWSKETLMAVPHLDYYGPDCPPFTFVKVVQTS